MGNLLADHKEPRRFQALVAVMLGRSPTPVNCLRINRERELEEVSKTA
jgi:hypothetical protein